MLNVGSLEIKITGTKGNLEVTPDNYDIRELISILENVEDLLYSGNKKNRQTISYRIEDGSVKHIFNTPMQFIIGFNAILEQVNKIHSIDFLEINTAKAFENIQDTALKKNYIFNIKTSLPDSSEVQIDKSTHYYRTETIWADAEFYFYGKVTNAGGKDKANIHLSTEEYGTLIIATPKPFLEQYEENLLYKPYGIRVRGKQHSETGEIDKSTLQFIGLVDYQSEYDEQYLKRLRDKVKKNWLGKMNADDWLRNIRGSYD